MVSPNALVSSSIDLDPPIGSRARFGRGLALFALALGLALTPACNKGGKGSKSPGGGPSQADIDRAVAQAKKQAKSNTLIDIANTDLAEGRYVSARKRAEEALTENPQDADAYAVLGAAEWRAGNYIASTEALTKALEINDTNYGATLGLARNLQSAGNHARAIELADGLIKEDKDQLDPYLTKLQSQYATLDAEGAIATLDEIFKRMPAEDPQLPLIQAQAAFLRPLAGKGKLVEISGGTGQSDVGIDHSIQGKYTGAEIGGDFMRVLLLENTEEAIIDADVAKKLGLKSLGKYKALGQDVEDEIVLVPEVTFGELKVKNVPALARSLAPYGELMGETPGMILGRQVLGSFGTIACDFPNRSLTLSKDAPASVPEGAIEVPFVLISMVILHAPAVPMKLAGSEHEFWVYLGGPYKAGVTLTQKNFLKSGHLPREVDPPDDANAGLKMVYIDGIQVGDQTLSGTGGLVLVNQPPDPTLGMFLDNTRFELGGYLNLALLENWHVTYSIPTGKAYFKPGA